MRPSADNDPARISAKLAQIKLLAMDVDGVLTDGVLGYDSAGGEQKRFHVADGLGLVLMKQVGITVAWISGRTSAAVERRAAELQIPVLRQGVRDKGEILAGLCRQLGMRYEEVAYVGDDWNDLPAFAIAGTRIAVANATGEVTAAADMVTEVYGGHGAVREVCDALLEARGQRASCLCAYLDSLRQSQ